MANCNILKATLTVDTETNNVVLTLPNTTEPLENRDILRFCITAAIPQDNPLGTATVVVNGTTFALNTVLGNSVRIEQLRSRYVYTVQVGAQNAIMVMKTCLPETSFVYPTYAAPEA